MGVDPESLPPRIGRRRLDRARLELLMRSAGLGLIEWDADNGRVLWASERAREIVGWEEGAPGEAERSFRDAIHPDDRDRVLRALELGLAGEALLHQAWRLRRGSAGEQRWVESWGCRIDGEHGQPDLFVTAIGDVTERLRAHLDMADSEARFRALFNALPVGAVVLDARGDVRLFNTIAHEQLGYTRAEFSGLCLADVSADHDRAAADARIAQVLASDEPVSFEAQHVARDGTPRARLVTMQRIRLDQDLVALTTWIDVTEARAARARIDEQAQRLRLALAAGRMGTWEIDLASGRRAWDATQMELFGLSPEQAPPDAAALHATMLPEDLERLARLAERAVADDGEFEAEFRIRRGSDGAPRWIASRGRYVAGEAAGGRLIGVSFDVTERKRTEQELAASRERLELAMLAGQMGTWEHELATGEQHWSPSLFALYGWSPQGPAPSLDDWLLHVVPEDRSQVRAAMRALGDAHPHQGAQFRVRRADDGELRWIEAQGRWLRDPASGAVRTVGVAIDVTGRVLAEQQLREADARKDEFLATLAHELRNPLVPLRNIVALLHRRGPQSADEALVEMMERQVAQLQRLVDDLLEVGRIRQGKIVLRLERAGIAAAVYSALETTQPRFEARAQRLVAQLEAAAPVLVDTARMAQVVTNLLNNASKFSPLGARILLATRDEPTHVSIQVRDEGIGITPEQLPRVFDLFEQGAATTPDQAQSGLGIGLSLVKTLVELHGGTVSAASDGPGRGAVFTVRLPRADG